MIYILGGLVVLIVVLVIQNAVAAARRPVETAAETAETAADLRDRFRPQSVAPPARQIRTCPHR